MFKKKLHAILSDGGKDHFEASAPLLEKLSLAQAFYRDNREALLIIVADAIDEEEGYSVPELMNIMDQEVNKHFGIHREFHFSEEALLLT